MSRPARRTDLELALQHRRGAELRLDDQLHGGFEQLVVVLVARAAADPSEAAGRALALDALDVRDFRACRRQCATTLRTSSSVTQAPWIRWRMFGGAQVEHVAPTHQALGPRLVEDDPAVGQARHREGEAGRDVGLDDARDHVHRRALRGDDEWMPTARHLGDATDGLLHPAATIIRSLSSSTTTTMNGSRDHRFAHSSPRERMISSCSLSRSPRSNAAL